MKKLSLLTFIFFLTIALPAQTTFSGGIYSNTTWTLSGSPYIINGNVVVFDNITLTVDPGVIIRVDDNTGIEIRGTLNSSGTVADTITFTTNNPSATSGVWFGITFKTDLNSTLAYTKIEYATRAVDNFNAVFASWSVNHCRFDHDDVAAYLNSAETNNFSQCKFDNNGTAVTSEQYSNISNCDFTDNAIGIGYLFDTYVVNCNFLRNGTGIDSYKANITGSTFSYNTVGLRIKLFTQSVVQNNSFTNNTTGLLVRGDPQLPAAVSGNTICGNTYMNVENQDYISIDFRNNCWCSNDSAGIAQYIWDGYDNVSLGLIGYSPWTSCALGISEPAQQSPAEFWQDDAGFLHVPSPASEIEIYNADGQLVMHCTDSAIADISGLSTGMYIVRVVDCKGNLSSGRFVKQ